MIILGIDPGTTKVGFGLIESKASNIKFLSCGRLNFDKYNPEERLLQIFREISKIIEKEKPEVVAVEKVFFAKNKKTAIQVSEARGAIITAILSKNTSLRSYTPLQIKQAVSSYGQAGKKEVQKMVRLLLNLESDPEPYDAADALAVAICCAQSMKTEQV